MPAFAESASVGRPPGPCPTRTRADRPAVALSRETHYSCPLCPTPRREVTVSEQRTTQLVAELFDHLAVTMADSSDQRAGRFAVRRPIQSNRTVPGSDLPGASGDLPDRPGSTGFEEDPGVERAGS